MKANLRRVSGLVRAAHKATIFERATLAMQAVDTAAALLAEMVEEIEQLKGRVRDLETDAMEARLRELEAKGGAE